MPRYLDLAQMRADGHIGTAFDGRVHAIYDEFRHLIVIYDRENNRLGTATEEAWALWDDQTKARWLADLLVDHKRNVRDNTQGVIDYLADIGRRWAAA